MQETDLKIKDAKNIINKKYEPYRMYFIAK